MGCDVDEYDVNFENYINSETILSLTRKIINESSYLYNHSYAKLLPKELYLNIVSFEEDFLIKNILSQQLNCKISCIH